MAEALSAATLLPIDPRINAVASGVAAAIPDAQLRLFGAQARRKDRPDSNVDLLITVPDLWLTNQNRVHVLEALGRQRA